LENSYFSGVIDRHRQIVEFSPYCSFIVSGDYIYMYRKFYGLLTFGSQSLSFGENHSVFCSHFFIEQYGMMASGAATSPWGLMA